MGTSQKERSYGSTGMPNFQNCDSGSCYWVKSSHLLHFAMKLNALSQGSHQLPFPTDTNHSVRSVC